MKDKQQFRVPAPDPPPKFFEEPADPVLIHGEMLRDARLLTEFLQDLPFAGRHYRTNLRQIIGAAERTKRRCVKLIGEDVGEYEAVSEMEMVTGDEGTGTTIMAKLVKKKRRNLLGQKKTHAPAEALNGKLDDIHQKILKQLRKCAVPSEDLVQLLKAEHTAAEIYPALQHMRERGLIETRDDPADGYTRKNFEKHDPRKGAELEQRKKESHA